MTKVAHQLNNTGTVTPHTASEYDRLYWAGNRALAAKDTHGEN